MRSNAIKTAIAVKSAVKGGPVSQFIESQYHHFNAATLKDAANAYADHIDNGGLMFLSLAGAMSTGELGRCLAPMIREGKIHGMSVTGANLEEDLFNLVAHNKYERIEDYHNTTKDDDAQLLKRELPRVTDTGIPQSAAMAPIEQAVEALWSQAEKDGEPIFPHEPLYDLLWNKTLAKHYTGDPAHSWLLAAAEVNLPIFVPGWEDSTLGQVFTALCLTGSQKSSTIKSGIDYGVALARWYYDTQQDHDLGFFQIGGGIAGDFSICVAPLLRQDVGEPSVKQWTYFCQITDADESYGGYSGALPSEKITWDKIAVDTPAYCIKSDATIVFPLIAARVLGW